MTQQDFQFIYLGLLQDRAEYALKLERLELMEILFDMGYSLD